MELLFSVDSLLCEPDRVTVPLPGVGAAAGTWTWLEYQAADAPALPLPAFPADTFARLADVPPVVHDGWLRLTLGTQDTALTYVATPAALPCGVSTELLLSVLNTTTQAVVVDSIVIAVPAGLVAQSALVSVTANTPWPVAAGPADPAGRPTWRLTAGGATVAAGAVVTVIIQGLSAPGAPGQDAVGVTETTVVTGAPPADPPGGPPPQTPQTATAACPVQWLRAAQSAGGQQ
jgi:hypothetical protein